ncbi:MAG: hypothetical protein B7X76_01145, partial [Azorhizobium sp. 39-67-5]
MNCGSSRWTGPPSSPWTPAPRAAKWWRAGRWCRERNLVFRAGARRLAHRLRRPRCHPSGCGAARPVALRRHRRRPHGSFGLRLGQSRRRSPGGIG